MKRIFSISDSYSLVASSSVYELDYENQILRFANQIFPGYFCLKFKCKVESVYGNCIPDLVLIDKSYRDWYVVEVELEHHSLLHHVLDQVTSMHHGEYNEKHADYLLSQCETLDESRLKELVRQHPHTMVIVPVSKVSWKESLYQFKTLVMTIEVWKNDRRDSILKIDGDVPKDHDQSFVSEIEIDRALPRLLKVKNIAGLPATGEIEIEIDGSTSYWTILNIGNGKWLNPVSKSPLPENPYGVFLLSRRPTGEFMMEAKI